MKHSTRSIFGDLELKDYLALLAVVVLIFSVYFSSLRAALDVRQDDHRIVFFGDPVQTLHDQVLTAQDASGRLKEPTIAWFLANDAEEAGRFRPLTQVLEVLLPRALGTDPFQWHLLVLLLGSLMATALFLLGRGLGGSWVEGAAMALLVALAPDPGPAKVWYMMSVKAETFGTLFVLFAVLASVRAARPQSRMVDEVLPLVLLAAAMLCKEPFALLLPVLLVIRLGLPVYLGYIPDWRNTPRLRFVVFAYLGLGLMYAAAIAISLTAAPENSYGTDSLTNWSMLGQGLRSTFSHLPAQSAGFVPALLAAAALLFQRGLRGSLSSIVLPFALALAWGLPQIFLYSLRGGMWDHYWLPCILGFAGLNVWGLRVLRVDGPRACFWLASVVVAASLANGLRTNIPTTKNYVQRTLMREEALASLARNVPADGKVLIVADNKPFSEYASSWIFFLGHEGRPRTTVLLYDVAKPGSTTFLKTIFFPHSTRLDQLESCDVDAIVFLNRPAESDLAWKNWYQAGCFRIESYTRPQEYFSLRKLGLDRQTERLDVAFREGLR